MVANGGECRARTRLVDENLRFNVWRRAQSKGGKELTSFDESIREGPESWQGTVPDRGRNREGARAMRCRTSDLVRDKRSISLFGEPPLPAARGLHRAARAAKVWVPPRAPRSRLFISLLTLCLLTSGSFLV